MLTLQGKKTYEQIMEKIQTFFLNGELQSGEKLPSERELASQFNVSRTSVREALQALEMKDIIEIRRGGGSFIKTTKVQLLSEKLSEKIIKSENNLVYEMLELRRALEVESASLAAQRATSKDLDAIRQTVKKMAISINEVDAGIQADLSFHLQIAQATHNTLIINLFQTLSERMEDTIRATRTHRFSDPSRYEGTFNEHKEIYLAIASGDAMQAKRLMEEHITSIRRELSASSLAHIVIE